MSITDATVPFEKYHGTGNDFIVVDATDPVPDRQAFARAHCDRTSGVGGDTAVDANADTVAGGRRGADGVLFLALGERYSPPRVVMTLVQPDGSVAPMCGNGARVAAAWAAERTGSDAVMIDTPAGTRRATVHGDEVTIEMGVPSFAPRDVPLDRAEPLIDEPVEGLVVTAVDTGVPHAVTFVDDVGTVDVEAVAPPVRHAPVFPEGANVTFAAREEVGVGGDTDSGDSTDGDADTEDGTVGDAGFVGAFRQRTFERGVEGETRSCGTGAVAVVAAARRVGLLAGDGPVRVTPPGGDLVIEVPDAAIDPSKSPPALPTRSKSATLRGPVVHEFGGELDATPSVD